MNKIKDGPSWWLLFLSLPMMIGLFLIEIRLSLSDTGHRMVELLIFLVFVGIIWFWLRTNTGALIQDDLDNWHAALGVGSSPISPPSLKTNLYEREHESPVAVNRVVHP